MHQKLTKHEKFCMQNNQPQTQNATWNKQWLKYPITMGYNIPINQEFPILSFVSSHTYGVNAF